MTLRLSVLLLTAVLVAGCADESDSSVSTAGPFDEPAAGGPVESPDERPAPEVRPGVSLDRLLAERSDDADVLAGLQPPRALRADPVVNEYVQGQTDTVRTYVYDGLQIEAYEVADGRTFVRRVDVTGAEYGTASGLAVGETREQVEAILGIPFQEDGNVAAYLAGPEEAPTTVEVEYEPDEGGAQRVTAISWIPYLD